MSDTTPNETLRTHLRAARYEIRESITALGHAISGAIGLPVPEVQQRRTYDVNLNDNASDRIPITTFTLPERGSALQESIRTSMHKMFGMVKEPSYDDIEKWGALQMGKTDDLEVTSGDGTVVVTGELPADYQRHLTGELRQQGFVFLGSTALFREVI